MKMDISDNRRQKLEFTPLEFETIYQAMHVKRAKY